VSILDRPDIVVKRREFGNWECDRIQFRKTYCNANMTSVVAWVSCFAVFQRNNDRQSKPILDGLAKALQARRGSDLPLECQPRGLRTASRRLAGAGCSTRVITAILGHKSLKNVELYTKAENRQLLATTELTALDMPDFIAKSLISNIRFWEYQNNLWNINRIVGKMALPRGIEPLFSP